LRDAFTRGVCVLDVSRFGKLTKYNDLEFVVKPIDDERATDILSRDADIVKAPEGLSDSVEESKRQLLLRVEFRLYESYSFELRDAEACFSTGWTASAS